MILLLFVDIQLIINLYFFNNGQNANEHRPQDRIEKMSCGVDFLSFFQNFIPFPLQVYTESCRPGPASWPR